MKEDKMKDGLRFDNDDNGPMTALPVKTFAEDNSLLIPRGTRRMRRVARGSLRFVIVH